MTAPSDIQINQSAKLRPIADVAADIGLTPDDIEFYGKFKAKIPLEVLRRFDRQPMGHLIYVTAMTPTPEGEGKTTTAIGLTQALGHLGKKVMLALREPSLGPTFGLKGGATGAGYSQVCPMVDINLHFTGDLPAVASANNLLSAMIDNILTHRNRLNIDITRIHWRRVVDMNDRTLRSVVVGLGGRLEGGVPRQTSFDITVASEVMAILSVSQSIRDLKDRLSRIVVAFTNDDKPVTVADIKAQGAMAILLKDAIKPNIVQTLEGQPVFIHCGPFANIAHGNNSIIATKYALRFADYAITEGGFGADLGAEKFFNIICPLANLKPEVAVIVASVKALHYHGGIHEKAKLKKKNMNALQIGFANLERHINNIKKFGLPVVVAINRFAHDDQHELDWLREKCLSIGVRAAVSEVVAKGGKGGIELANEVLVAIDSHGANFKAPIYSYQLPIKDKIMTIAREIYGAKDVIFTTTARKEIELIEKLGYGGLPINMAKTQLSFSDDKKAYGAPGDWKMTVREVRLAAGAGFIIPLTGEIMTMPGLPKVTQAEKMDIDDSGQISGLN